MPLSPGTTLGPYEILSPLGAGGMGEVYRARDTRLDRTVAVKVLPAHLSADPDARQRFEREARAVSALNHPHICVLFDIGQQNGVDFLVMEHLEGETLADRLKKGPLPLESVLRHGQEIARALDAAHRQGIVHRDLKPGNVMLTKAGAKLLDFGLAKAAAPVVGGSATSGLTSAVTEARPLTAEGMIAGTIEYMAPEQVEGHEPDARADIFAFGAVLHEMATGQRAFTGKSPASVIASILRSSPPPVSSVQPLAPAALDRLIATCLAKDPDDRWQSARDLATQLGFIASGASTGSGVSMAAAPGPGRRGRERMAWLAALLAAILGPLLGFIVARQWKRPEARPRYRFDIRAPEGTFLPAQPSVPAISPDGERLVFTASDGEAAALYVRPLGEVTALKLPGATHAAGAFWSPDSRHVAFMQGNALRRVELGGVSAQRICTLTAGRSGGASWSTGGVILYSMNGELYTVPAAGGEGQPLGKLAPGELAREAPRFLPDGRHFLYTSRSQKPDEAGIYVASLDGKTRQRLVASDANADYSRTGHLYYMRGDALVAQPFDGVSALSGEPVPVVDRLMAVRRIGMAQFSVSDNGVIAWRRPVSRNLQLAWFDRAGLRLGTVGDAGPYTSPALSPDDTRLAVALEDPSQQTRDLWVFDLVRGTRTRVTSNDADDFNPTWSPDGRRLAFASDKGGLRDLYVKAADGSGSDEKLIAHAENNRHPEHWSAGGFLIFNYWHGSRPVDLYRLPMSGTVPREPAPLLATDFGEQQARVSPDDRWLAYNSNESGRWEVFVTAFSPANAGVSGRWQISSGGGTTPFWRGDGKELYYLADHTIMAVDVKATASSFEAGLPRRLFDVRVQSGSRSSYAVTRDGRRFLVATVPEGLQDDPIQVLVNGLAR